MYVGTMDARSPWTRLENLGIRCALYEGPVDEALLAPVERARPRDYTAEAPVGDDVFQTIGEFYSYDPRTLDATVDSVDDSPRHWRMERVSFDAAYGDERTIGDSMGG